MARYLSRFERTALLEVAAGEQVVNFVDDQHPGSHPAQDVASQGLERRQSGGRSLRRADFEEERPIEAPLVGRGRHLHRDGRPALDAALSIERRRMLAQELGDDQRLADVRWPVHDHARHSVALGRLEQPLEPRQRFARARVVDPALALQRADTLLVVELRQGSGGRVQVSELRSCHHHISTGKGSTVLL